MYTYIYIYYVALCGPSPGPRESAPASRLHACDGKTREASRSEEPTSSHDLAKTQLTRHVIPGRIRNMHTCPLPLPLPLPPPLPLPLRPLSALRSPVAGLRSPVSLSLSLSLSLSPSLWQACSYGYINVLPQYCTSGRHMIAPRRSDR